MSLKIFTWHWGKKYPQEYVDRLSRGVERNLNQEFQFKVVTPPSADEALKDGCLCRLRMFDPAWQTEQGVNAGDRIVCMDLDMVITGALDPLFDRKDPFLILLGANAANPNPYNGSVWSIMAGYRPEVWSDFSLEAAAKMPFYAFPDDQAWMYHKMPDAKGWQVGSESGIYGFFKPGWPGGTELPAGAKIVSFFGKKDPAFYTHLPWVEKHWLGQ